MAEEDELRGIYEKNDGVWGYVARLFDKKGYILHCSKNTSKIHFNI